MKGFELSWIPLLLLLSVTELDFPWEVVAHSLSFLPLVLLIEDFMILAKENFLLRAKDWGALINSLLLYWSLIPAHSQVVAGWLMIPRTHLLFLRQRLISTDFATLLQGFKRKYHQLKYLQLLHPLTLRIFRFPMVKYLHKSSRSSRAFK